MHHWRHSQQRSVFSGVQISKYTRAIFGWETGCSNLDYQKQNLIECSLETLRCVLVSTQYTCISVRTLHTLQICTCMYSQSVPHVHLNNLWTDTCITVSRHGTCFGTVGHVQRMAKCTLKEFEEVRFSVRSFLKTAMHFLCFTSYCSSLSYSSTSPWISQGGGCILALCLHFHFVLVS